MEKVIWTYRCQGWRGEAHIIAEYRNGIKVAVYKGYHVYRKRIIVLYPLCVIMPFSECKKKTIMENDVKR